MEDSSLHYLETEGTPYERGRRVGARFTQLIRHGLETYCSFELPGYQQQALCRALEYTRDRFPEMIQELQGIAAGSGTDFMEIFRYNAFNAVSRVSQCCDTVAVADPSGRILLGGNADIDVSQRSFYFIHRIKAENTEVLALQWAGNLWPFGGMNSHGLACSATSAPDIPLGSLDGLPQHMALYPVLLRCTDVFSALDLLTRTRFIGKGLNIGLADSAGNVAMVEKSGDIQAVTLARGVTLFRTNHFTAADFQKYNEGAMLANSVSRYSTLTGLLCGRCFEDACTVLRKVLSSHGEGGLCQHGIMGMDTLASVILNPGEGWVEICGGRPCRAEYVRYTF